MSTTNRVSLHGKQLGLSPENNLVSEGIEITRPCVDATISVSAEGATTANVRDILIQLKDSRGKDIDYVETVDIIMFLTADMLAHVVTGGSTGLAIDGDGALLAIVAKKVFTATSEADGDIGLKWTDTGTEAAYLGLRLPSGRMIVSAALTNA